ncbi:MAG: hypothetical protein WBB34_04880 [Xanthobacteraceae bacterium]
MIAPLIVPDGVDLIAAAVGWTDDTSCAETAVDSDTAAKLDVKAAEESAADRAGAAGVGVSIAVAAAGTAALAAGVAASKVRIGVGDCGVDAWTANDWG